MLLPVLLSAALLLFIALAAGCGSSGDTPGETIENMVRASYDGDCEVVVGSMSQEFVDAVGGDRQQWIESCKEQESEMPDDRPTLVSFEVTDETINGDRAQVSFTVTENVGGEEQTSSRTMDLIKEDGEWKYTVTPQTPPAQTTTNTNVTTAPAITVTPE